jgi:RimJ/RimL family protein N-acetyltransferase/glycosyltransferase involved in cell wall biosynthesis
MYKVLIRPLQIEDAYISFKWRNDPEIWKYTGSRPDREITIEIEKKWIQSVLKDDSCRRFAILVDEKYIGNIQLTNIINGSAEYHIFIGDKSFWGKGISSLATYEILHYAKEELGLHNVYLSVREDNIFAIKAYKKNSFTTVSVENGWIKMNCNISLLPPPTVSVFVMVYNHEKYITKCLDGILMQKCNFSYNIVVGEDASTDKSREILLEYCKKYPGKFKLLLHEKNIGAMANQNEVFKACNGKYIAICEGDDYWTDPLKLQKQVDFMEANPEYGLVHTNFSTTNGKRVPFKKYPKNDQYLNGFLTAQFSIGTLTVLFRSDVYNSLPKCYQEKQFKMGDLPLWIEFARVSKIRYLTDKTAMYRVLENSASHSTNIEDEISFSKSRLDVKLFYIDIFKLHGLKKHAIKSFYAGIVKVAFQKQNVEYAEKYYKELCNFGSPGFKTIMFYLGSKYKIIRRAINFIYMWSCKLN